MAKHKLIVFASYDEAAPSLLVLKAEMLQERRLYQCAAGLIVISGLGCIAACAAVARYAAECDEIWNFGFAGVLRLGTPLGSIAYVREVGKHLSLPAHLDAHSARLSRAQHPPLQIAEAGVKLVSSDYPIHDERLRNTLCQDWELVDMEGYGIAYAAAQLNKPCRLCKIVSDFSQPGGARLIAQGKLALAEKLAERLCHSQVNDI